MTAAAAIQRVGPCTLTTLVALATLGAAPAAASPDASLTKVEATRRFGAMADVGLPDGATVALVVRPIRALRAHAGLSHNAISLGQRVGVSWIPLAWWASPTLSLEYGRYAEGNANPLVRMATGDEAFSSAILERVGYRYANAHIGVELGRKWFTFYLHAGVSRLDTTVHNISSETMTEAAGRTTVTFSKDPSITVTGPSARIGFIVYLAR
jgi:hypothetical protein